VHAPIEPMLAGPVETLPEGPGWAYEPKWDGWRAIAFCRTGGVHLQSRSARPLSNYFPDITRVVRANVPPGVVLDGELIVWERERTNFALLQRRITAGRHLLRMARDHPAHYVVFDLLRDVDGQELLDVPLSERRARLADLLVNAPAQVPLSPQTTDLAEAQEWLNTWTAAGIEGVMAKRLGSRYEPGRRGWLKLRAHGTTEAIIGGVTGTLQEPDTLLVGRFDQQGRLRYTGRTHPLSAVQRRELAPLLTLFGQGRSRGGEHPWPQPLPPAWSGQLDKPRPLPYIQVDPTVAAEIEVDTAFEHNRWRHRVRYVRPRLDTSIYDVPLLTPWPGPGGDSRIAGRDGG
jgi:ATP-dependent DNA ligase